MISINEAKALAKALGWVNFPDDSVQQGNIWYMEPEKAPQGRYFSEFNMRKHFSSTVFINKCIQDYHIGISWSPAGYMVLSNGINDVTGINKAGLPFHMFLAHYLTEVLS